MRIWWSMVSNAADKSNNTKADTSPLSSARRISSTNLRRAVSLVVWVVTSTDQNEDEHSNLGDLKDTKKR